MWVMFPLMNLIITKWLLVYMLENKHNFYVIHFLSLTVWYRSLTPKRPRKSFSFWFYGIISYIKVWKNDKFGWGSSKLRAWYEKIPHLAILTMLKSLPKLKKLQDFERQLLSLPAQQAKHDVRTSSPFLSVLRKSKHTASRFPTSIRH